MNGTARKCCTTCLNVSLVVILVRVALCLFEKPPHLWTVVYTLLLCSDNVNSKQMMKRKKNWCTDGKVLDFWGLALPLVLSAVLWQCKEQTGDGTEGWKAEILKEWFWTLKHLLLLKYWSMIFEGLLSPFVLSFSVAFWACKQQREEGKKEWNVEGKVSDFWACVVLKYWRKVLDEEACVFTSCYSLLCSDLVSSK